jgi:Fic family protein
MAYLDTVRALIACEAEGNTFTQEQMADQEIREAACNAYDSATIVRRIEAANKPFTLARMAKAHHDLQGLVSEAEAAIIKAKALIRDVAGSAHDPMVIVGILCELRDTAEFTEYIDAVAAADERLRAPYLQLVESSMRMAAALRCGARIDDAASRMHAEIRHMIDEE